VLADDCSPLAGSAHLGVALAACNRKVTAHDIFLTAERFVAGSGDLTQENCAARAFGLDNSAGDIVFHRGGF
jgi:hypothetical protein